jgi:predicted small secreted protein
MRYAMSNLSRMKFFILCAVSLSLVSCNTAIGVYRDTKQGFIWTKNKIQNSGGGGGASDPYGAPTY